MKIASIGDLHGRSNWKRFDEIAKILNDDAEPSYDKYVFIGDYVDSFNKSNVQILHNLKEVIKFKKKYPEHVELLWGNHDIQYGLIPPNVSINRYLCSGYRPEAHWDLYDIFHTNHDLFVFSYQYENYLFTHAGVHSGWYKFKFLKGFDEEKSETKTLSDKLNEAFKKRLSCLFDVGFARGGSNEVGGPLWLHKHPARKYLEGYHQIVGHTTLKEGISIEKGNTENSSVTFIDSPFDQGAFYIINT